MDATFFGLEYVINTNHSYNSCNSLKFVKIRVFIL